MDDAFELFRSNFGEPQHSVDAAGKVASFSGLLPPRILAHWQKEGFAAYRDGLLWITDPSQFEDVVSLWIKDLGLQEVDRFHTIARTGFGQLFIWGERTGHSLVIHPSMGFALPRVDDIEDMKNGNANECAAQFFGFLTPEELDVEDDEGKPLFVRALRKLGRLSFKEMYGFEPALPFGGELALKSLQKVSALEHMMIVSQATEKNFVDPDAFTEAARLHGLL